VVGGKQDDNYSGKIHLSLELLGRGGKEASTALVLREGTRSGDQWKGKEREVTKFGCEISNFS